MQSAGNNKHNIVLDSEQCLQHTDTTLCMAFLNFDMIYDHFFYCKLWIIISNFMLFIRPIYISPCILFSFDASSVACFYVNNHKAQYDGSPAMIMSLGSILRKCRHTNLTRSVLRLPSVTCIRYCY